jgi:hypothetical protein
VGENWRVLIVRYKDEPRQEGRNEVASSGALRAELPYEAHCQWKVHPHPGPLPQERGITSSVRHTFDGFGRKLPRKNGQKRLGDTQKALKTQNPLRECAAMCGYVRLDAAMCGFPQESGITSTVHNIFGAPGSKHPRKNGMGRTSGISLHFASLRFTSLNGGAPPPPAGEEGEESWFETAWHRLAPLGTAWRWELFLRPAWGERCEDGGWRMEDGWKDARNANARGGRFAFARLCPPLLAWRGMNAECGVRSAELLDYARPHPNPMASQARHKSVSRNETSASRYVVPQERVNRRPLLANLAHVVSSFCAKAYFQKVEVGA